MENLGKGIKRKYRSRTDWTTGEDKELIATVQQASNSNWKEISESLRRRLPGCNKNEKQCRERYSNYIDPQINHAPWTELELVLFSVLQRHFGFAWSTISQFFNHRTGVSVKNLLHMYVRKMLKVIMDPNLLSCLLKKPGNAIMAYFTLDRIKEICIQNLNESIENHKGSTLSNFIKNSGISLEQVDIAQDKLVEDIREHHVRLFFIYCNEDIPSFESNGKKFKDIIDCTDFGKLEGLVEIKLIEEKTKQVSFVPQLFFSSSLPKSDFLKYYGDHLPVHPFFTKDKEIVPSPSIKLPPQMILLRSVPPLFPFPNYPPKAANNRLENPLLSK